MTDHEHHARHHELIAKRVGEYRAMGLGVYGVERIVRREKFKKAYATLKDHLRCCHGVRTGMGTLITDLERQHDALHQETP